MVSGVKLYDNSSKLGEERDKIWEMMVKTDRWISD